MAQYIHYKFDQNSTTITNYGTGGTAYNGQAARNQYAKNSLGNPIWGPLDDNADRIAVAGGISNPYQHTWQIGLRISQWWPVDPQVVNGILCGNDGKLWAYANDLFYGYLHEECTYIGGVLTQLGTHYLTVEIQGSPSSLDAHFWLGVGSNKPTEMSRDPVGTDDPGALYQQFGGFDLKLNQDYYFQISVSANGPSGDYYIGNCAQGCADAFVSGFPCGCYLYSWREDDSVLDLSGGGNWADDVALWGGGVTPVTPVTPTTKGIPVQMTVTPRTWQPGR